MNESITTIVVPEQRVAYIREHIGQSDMPAFIGGAYAELYGYLAARQVTPVGEPLVVYHGFGPEIDAEAAVPVPDDLLLEAEAPNVGRIGVRVLPTATVARIVHVGPYDQLGTSYDALGHWIEDHGFAAAGPVREHYIDGPGAVPPADYLTRIEIPIVEVAAFVTA